MSFVPVQGTMRVVVARLTWIKHHWLRRWVPRHVREIMHFDIWRLQAIFHGYLILSCAMGILVSSWHASKQAATLCTERSYFTIRCLHEIVVNLQVDGYLGYMIWDYLWRLYAPIWLEFGTDHNCTGLNKWARRNWTAHSLELFALQVIVICLAQVSVHSVPGLIWYCGWSLFIGIVRHDHLAKTYHRGFIWSQHFTLHRCLLCCD